MRSRPIVVSTDIDNTFAYRAAIPAAHVAAVRELRSLGADVVFATGRRHFSASAMLDAAGITAAVVASNGATLHPLQGAVSCMPFNAHDARKVVSELHAEGF